MMDREGIDLDGQFHDDFLSAARDVLAERNVTNLVVGTEGDNLPKAIRDGLDERLAGHGLRAGSRPQATAVCSAIFRRGGYPPRVLAAVARPHALGARYEAVSA